MSGVSQRKMGDVTEALMGERVGRSTVSRVAKRLDEGVQTLRSAPIEGAHPYLYLDGDVPRCPLGPKGRERERARGLLPWARTATAGSWASRWALRNRRTAGRSSLEQLLERGSQRRPARDRG